VSTTESEQNYNGLNTVRYGTVLQYSPVRYSTVTYVRSKWMLTKSALIKQNQTKNVLTKIFFWGQNYGQWMKSPSLFKLFAMSDEDTKHWEETKNRQVLLYFHVISKFTSDSEFLMEQKQTKREAPKKIKCNKWKTIRTLNRQEREIEKN